MHIKPHMYIRGFLGPDQSNDHSATYERSVSTHARASKQSCHGSWEFHNLGTAREWASPITTSMQAVAAMGKAS